MARSNDRDLEVAPELEFALHEDSVAVLSHYASGLVAEPPDEWHSIYQFGRDPLSDLCLDGNRGGTVIHLDLERPGSARYVNFSIELLAELLYMWNCCDEIQEGAALRLWLDAFANHLHSQDPEALRDPEGWWSVILEDAHNLSC